jgi:predicted RNase H-like HicB family nuclease
MRKEKKAMKFGYTAKEACKVASISYKQLNYWDKLNLAKPSIAGARGTGSRRIYSFVDLVCLRVTAKLKKEGISLQKIRKSMNYLSRHFPEYDKPLANFVFLTDGSSIFVLTDKPNTVIDTLQEGQFVLSVAVGYIAEETKEKVLSLEREEEETGHVFEVVIEPDDDVYYAHCPALRGCRTWGHTKAEAFQYIQDAIGMYLEDLIEDGEPIPGIGVVKSLADVKPVIRERQPKQEEVEALA